MSPSSNLKFIAENIKLKRSAFICLSAHNASVIGEIYWKSPHNQFGVFQNIKTLLDLQ